MVSIGYKILWGVVIVFAAGCTSGPAATPILIHLPTASATPTTTPTAILTNTATPGAIVPAIQTPAPYLIVNLTIFDVETGAAARGDVLLALFVDGNELTYPLERNVSEMSVELPRDVMQAEAVYIIVTAPGYLDSSTLLPSEAKTAPQVSLEAFLGKTSQWMTSRNNICRFAIAVKRGNIGRLTDYIRIGWGELVFKVGGISDFTVPGTLRISNDQ